MMNKGYFLQGPIDDNTSLLCTMIGSRDRSHKDAPWSPNQLTHFHTVKIKNLPKMYVISITWLNTPNDASNYDT